MVKAIIFISNKNIDFLFLKKATSFLSFKKKYIDMLNKTKNKKVLIVMVAFLNSMSIKKVSSMFSLMYMLELATPWVFIK